MNEYRLIEYTSEKKTHIIKTNSLSLHEVLFSFYKDKFDMLFDEQGHSRGYFSLFINNQQVSSILDITLDNKDEISVISSISGG